MKDNLRHFKMGLFGGLGLLAAICLVKAVTALFNMIF